VTLCDSLGSSTLPGSVLSGHSFDSSSNAYSNQAKLRMSARRTPLTPLRPSRVGVLQRKCAWGGGCPSCKSDRASENRLAISEPGDALEQEADRMADLVMRTPDAPASPAGRALQRKCVVCEEEEKSKLQTKRRSSDGGHPVTSAPPIVHEALRSPGQPLGEPTRMFMESRFRRDFGDVRVHTDGRAAESARAVNALAYTVGRDIVFASGNYSPYSSAGRRLIAHELTHALQQGVPASASASRLESPHGAPEHGADEGANSALVGSVSPLGTGTSGRLVQRQPAPGTSNFTGTSFEGCDDSQQEILETVVATAKTWNRFVSIIFESDQGAINVVQYLDLSPLASEDHAQLLTDIHGLRECYERGENLLTEGITVRCGKEGSEICNKRWFQNTYTICGESISIPTNYLAYDLLKNIYKEIPGGFFDLAAKIAGEFGALLQSAQSAQSAVASGVAKAPDAATLLARQDETAIAKLKSAYCMGQDGFEYCGIVYQNSKDGTTRADGPSKSETRVRDQCRAPREVTEVGETPVAYYHSHSAGLSPELSDQDIGTAKGQIGSPRLPPINFYVIGTSRQGKVEMRRYLHTPPEGQGENKYLGEFDGTCP